jgi:hypothetical protein
MIFQIEVVGKIHCCCIEGGIYNLNKAYFLNYLYPTSTWHGTWAIMRRNSNTSTPIVVNLL